MHAFDVLGDPVRRRILELLAGGEHSAGDVTAVIGREFGISQPAVSQHLKVLRDSGFAAVRADGARRIYAVEAPRFAEVDQWLAQFRDVWNQHLDALATELARGRRARRRAAGREADPPDPPDRSTTRDPAFDGAASDGAASDGASSDGAASDGASSDGAPSDDTEES